MKTSEKITHNCNDITIVQTYEIRLKPSRIPRKLKKRIKADIHRFFTFQKSYKVSPLINWQKRFNIK